MTTIYFLSHPHSQRKSATLSIFSIFALHQPNYVAVYLFTVSMAAFAQVAGFTIPPNQPDGVYQVLVYPNGTEEHARIDIDGHAAQISYHNKTRAVAEEMPNSALCLTNQRKLEHGATDAANSALDAQFGNNLDVLMGCSVYSKSGCVVAYFCAIDGGWGCSANIRQNWSGRITQECGRYFPGYAEWNDYDYERYSYG